jgi:maleate cis-trans isomerase
MRLGVIYPSDDDTELRHLADWLGCRGVSDVEVAFGSSLSDGSHAISSLKQTGALEILQQAVGILSGKVDAVVWACTSGSFIGGLAAGVQQLTAMQEVAGVPVTSTSFALVRAVKSLGVDKVDVLSPYPGGVGKRFTSFLEASGITTICMSNLNAHSGPASRKIDLNQAIDSHVREFGNSPVPLLIPDTAIDTLDVVEGLEERCCRLILTANQASIWDLLRIAGSRTKLKNAGRLFRC